MVKEYADGERVPIRLVQENGNTIELDATSIDMVVERIQSNFGIPFMSAKKFGIDLNQAAVMFEVQGVFTDEAGQEGASGAVAQIDFHQTQWAQPVRQKSGSSGQSSRGEEQRGTYTTSEGEGFESVGQKGYNITHRPKPTSMELYQKWHGRHIRLPMAYWLDEVTLNSLPSVGGLTNLFWFDAVQSVTGVAHGGSISSFVDKSSNAFTFTASGAPKYYENGASGRPYVLFDGSSDKFTKSFESTLNPASFTIFTVAQSDVDSNTTQTIFSSREGNDGGYLVAHDWNGTNNRAKSWIYNDGVDTSLAGDNTLTMHDPVIACTTYTADAVNLYVNGKKAGSGTTGTEIYDAATSGSAYLGAWSTSHYFSGRIYEVIMFDGVLDSTRRQIVEGYLSNKYNIGLVGENGEENSHFYYWAGQSAYLPDAGHVNVYFDAERIASKNEPYGYVNYYRSTSLTVDSGASPTTTSCRLSASIKTWIETGDFRPYQMAFYRGGQHLVDITLRTVDPGGTNITFDDIGTAPQVGDVLYLGPDTEFQLSFPWNEVSLVLPIKNAGDDVTTGGPTYPNYADGTTRFAGTALSSLSTTITRTDEYIAHTLAQLLSHSSVDVSDRAVNAAGDTTMDKVFSTVVSTAADGSNTLLTITQVHKNDLGSLGLGANLSTNLPPDKTPLIKGFTGGKSGKTVKSAGDKVQDILGILGNSQNFGTDNSGSTIGDFIEAFSGALTQDVYRQALSGDYITAIQIPYNSLVTLGQSPLDTKSHGVAQRNFFLTVGNVNTALKTSVSNITHASKRYAPYEGHTSARNGIHGIVTDFNVKRDAAMKAYEFSLQFIAADIII